MVARCPLTRLCDWQSSYTRQGVSNALLVDVENVWDEILNVSDSSRLSPDEVVLRTLEAVEAHFGSAIVRDAFADFSRVRCSTECKHAFARAGFQIRDCYSVKGPRRSVTDSKIILRAVDLERMGTVNAFVLVTGDGDFCDLVHWLRERDHHVAVIAPRQKTNGFLRVACDVALDFHSLVERCPDCPLLPWCLEVDPPA